MHPGWEPPYTRCELFVCVCMCVSIFFVHVSIDNTAKKLGIIIIIIIICISISNNFAVPAKIVEMLSKVFQINFIYIIPFYSILSYIYFICECSLLAEVCLGLWKETIKFARGNPFIVNARQTIRPICSQYSYITN